MHELGKSQVKHQLATLRDPARSPAERALAAATVCAACGARNDRQDAPFVATPTPRDPAQRMFGYGSRHANARVWDGKSTRTGTITFVDDERIEQYVGQQEWIAYRPSDLGTPGFVVGDQVRIAGRPGALRIEAIGTNRLANARCVQAPTVRSGMVVLRTVATSAAEMAAAARTIAERYAASITDGEDRIVLTFTRGSQLVICSAAFEDFTPLAALVSAPFASATRLEAHVPASHAEAALDAECALAYGAAFFATSGEAIAVDDTGAVLCSEGLYELGVRDRSRAAAFRVAAAAAQRLWPAPSTWFSNRGGVCDELTILSSRPWRADFASAFLNRTFDAFSQTLQLTGDPVIPLEGEMYVDAERTGAGSLQRLTTLYYPTVSLEIAFLDAAVAEGSLRASIEARHDIAALLGAPILSAVVIAFGNRAEDVDSAAFSRDMQRADVLTTAIGAALARRDDAIALDAVGALYSADELVELAIQRRGKCTSWPARVADVRRIQE